MTSAEKFFESIKDKKVAFIGIGVSHTDVIRQFAEKGIATEARDKTDREALLEGILDGTVDVIATDHAPHSEEEKSRGLEKSAMGITGIETAFPILYTKLVKTGVITLEKLVELLNTNARKQVSQKGQ